ncbi:unnamed protein product, partial [Amoebophrya sp. A120]
NEQQLRGKAGTTSGQQHPKRPARVDRRLEFRNKLHDPAKGGSFYTGFGGTASAYLDFGSG